MTTFRFIRHEDVPAWQACGWEPLPDLEGTHHGQHARLMRWKGEGEPAEPEQAEEEAA